MKTVIAAATLALAATPACLAQVGSRGGPVDITADRSEFVDAEGMSRWSGNVDVRQGDARLLADEIDVYFGEQVEGKPGAIQRIVARGKVAYITAEEIARGDRGVYTAATDRIELTGAVTLIRGKSTLTGDRLIVNPAVGRSTVYSDSGSTTRDDRVRGVFFPEEEKATDKAAGE